MRIEDPWYDSFGSARSDERRAELPSPTLAAERQGERRDTLSAASASASPRQSAAGQGDARALPPEEVADGGRGGSGRELGAVQGESEVSRAREEVYLAVHRSPAFQQVRSRYRGFALPVSAAFLLWYFAYVVAATSAPQLMARPLVGVMNVGMAAGLAQFATTFLLTWAYAWHAARRRDGLARELRWETQDMARAAVLTRQGRPEERR